MLYRRYTPEDFPALYAIEEVCFESPARFGHRTMRLLVDDPDSATWIADRDGQVTGFAIAVWAAETDGAAAYIQTLEVVPTERGQGIGGELLRRLEASASAAGVAMIWLHVDAENRVAIRLYQAHGYLCERAEEDYYGPGRAALVYGKRLDSAMAS